MSCRSVRKVRHYASLLPTFKERVLFGQQPNSKQSLIKMWRAMVPRINNQKEIIGD
jgi:hypothetical protein